MKLEIDIPMAGDAVSIEYLKKIQYVLQNRDDEHLPLYWIELVIFAMQDVAAGEQPVKVSERP